MLSVIEQQRYQVRFDWGASGLAAIAEEGAVVVWVDALDPAPPPEVAAGCALVTTGLDGSAATAAWVLAVQEARQRRTTVAVVAAGASAVGGARFAVEDLLAAGALLDGLEARGIDAMSPEAAAADAAYRGLRPGLRSILTAVARPGTAAGPPAVLRPHPYAPHLTSMAAPDPS